jgi:hypothetical protein
MLPIFRYPGERHVMTTIDSPSSDVPFSVQGYITDPKRSGYQILTNYESTYWRALVGAAAWGLYEVLRSYCHHGHTTCHPSINLLMAILGIKERRSLTGRVTVVEDREYRYPGLIDTLQQHQLLVAEEQSEGATLRYLFHVNLTPGQLNEEQLGQLPAILQQKHAELLARCQAEQEALQAKQRPSKIEKIDKSAPLQGSGNLPQGSGKLPDKQYINITHRTKPSARANLMNNNSGAKPSSKSDKPDTADDKQDVVVVLVKEKISEKSAIRLAQHYDRQRILEKVDFLAYLRDHDPDQVKKPQGWLRRAIEEDYGPPDGYRSPADRAAEAAAQQQQDKKMQQAMAVEQRREEERLVHEQQKATAWRTHLEQTYGTTQRELDLWHECLDEFEFTMPAATFQTCVADTILLSLQNDEALIGLSNPGARDWVENRLTNKIQRALSVYSGVRKVTAKFIILDLPDALAVNSTHLGSVNICAIPGE